MTVPSLDDDDWVKQTWDFWNPDHTPASTLAEFRALLPLDDAGCKKLLALPVGRAMPASLRAEIEAL